MLTANEAVVSENLFLLLLLTPQVSKRVNDHTKDQVQYDNDHNEEEEQVIDHPQHKQRLL